MISIANELAIKRLKKKRQRNVQEQNALQEYGIKSEALYWRAHALPKALIDAGRERGIDWDLNIILDLNIDCIWLPPLSGALLSQTDQFISFEIDTDAQHQNILAVEEWSDVTHRQNLHMHNRGTGVGYGAMAMKIRQEICFPQQKMEAEN